MFLSPWLIVFLVFWLYPLIFSLILSFCRYDAFHPALLQYVGLKNYLRLLSDKTFIQAFLNTLAFVVGTTPVTTLLALCLALLINNGLKGSSFFKSAFFLPSIISIVVTATVFKAFYSPIGLFNSILSFFGVSARAWLTQTNLAMPAVMLMNIWAFTGYYMVLYLAALKSVPQQLYDAAEVDGANEWQQFIYITLPQIRYMTLFILTVNTIRSWQVFPEIFTLTKGGPMGTTNTLVNHLYETAFRYHQMGYASAISYVLLIIIMLCFFIQVRVLRGKKETKNL